MGRLHWGGGTPTILPPALIHRLARVLKAAIPHTPDWEFSVEIDPTMVDRAKIAALRDEGLNRASIGVQDFAPEVQQAIAGIFAAVKAAGKPLGTLAPVEADARRYLDMGASFVAVGSDLGAFKSATQALRDRFRS